MLLAGLSQSVLEKKIALGLEYGYWPHMQDLAHFFPIQTSRMANTVYSIIAGLTPIYQHC